MYSLTGFGDKISTVFVKIVVVSPQQSRGHISLMSLSSAVAVSPPSLLPRRRAAPPSAGLVSLPASTDTKTPHYCCSLDHGLQDLLVSNH